MTKVTVLTAVYNAELYLRQCLDSLAAQTLPDCQYICIDDASTDNSPAILDEYAQRDSRFQIIHLPENQGLAAARNNGLRQAEGQFVTMLDSDDWLAPDTLETAYRALLETPQADIALLRLVRYNQQDGTTHVQELSLPKTKNLLTGYEAFLLSIDNWKIHGLYLVRRTIHQQYPYDETTSVYSDENTTHIHYLHARHVVISQAPYYYRIHQQSVTHRISIHYFDRLESNYSLKRQLLDEAGKGWLADTKDVLDRYEVHRWLNIVDACWYLYLHQDDFTPDQQRDIHQRIATHLHTIETRRLSLRLKCKPGYMPVKHYPIFHLLENTYFRLKIFLQRQSQPKEQREQCRTTFEHCRVVTEEDKVNEG